MNKETYEALKNVVKKTRNLLNSKYSHRKRLTRDEVWEKATTIRDITDIERWIDEVAKEYTEEENCLHNWDNDQGSLGICKTCGDTKTQQCYCECEMSIPHIH